MKTVGRERLALLSGMGSDIDENHLVLTGYAFRCCVEFIDLPGDDAPVPTHAIRQVGMGERRNTPIRYREDEDVVMTSRCRTNGLSEERLELDFVFFA